ncbi:MAG: hypothetical protein MK085_02245, partial [Phycisphaerales bacterium]|nr:hypothetical protein [Phycisphaerales bacterium]
YLELGADTRVYPADVPILHHPLALHLVHSYSLKLPENTDTIGGRFLDRGVYAYVGSVHEPYLMAFQPPELIVKRLSVFTPFLAAGRAWEGNVSRSWRLTTIGDPLMLVQPPSRRTRKLTGLPEIPGGENVVRAAQEQLRAFRENPQLAASAMDMLALIGRDDVAAKVWEVLQQEGNLADITRAAPAALGPLFRTRSFDAFIDAYERLPQGARRDEAQDMLWHLATPRLGTLQEPDVIALLARSPRQSSLEVDLRRLKPHLDRVLGEGSGRAVIQRALESARTESSRKALRKLLAE